MCRASSWHFGVDLIDRESLRVDNLSILCILGNWSNCWSRANFLIYLAGTCPVVYTHCVVHPLIIWLVRSGSRKAESQRNFMFCSSNYIECKSLLSFRFCHTVCLWAEHKHIRKMSSDIARPTLNFEALFSNSQPINWWQDWWRQSISQSGPENFFDSGFRLGRIIAARTGRENDGSRLRYDQGTSAM